jgi:hypothetical protein
MAGVDHSPFPQLRLRSRTPAPSLTTTGASAHVTITPLPHARCSPRRLAVAVTGPRVHCGDKGAAGWMGKRGGVGEGELTILQRLVPHSPSERPAPSAPAPAASGSLSLSLGRLLYMVSAARHSRLTSQLGLPQHGLVVAQSTTPEPVSSPRQGHCSRSRYPSFPIRPGAPNGSHSHRRWEDRATPSTDHSPNAAAGTRTAFQPARQPVCAASASFTWRGRLLDR